MTLIQIVLAIGLALLALLVTMPIVRRGQSRATIDLLRSELAVETTAREAQEKRCSKEIGDLRSQHDRELGELRGQLAVVTRDFARTIAAELVGAMREAGVIK